MTALSGDTAVWLIHAAESTEMHLPILMALCTGMRRGEILGLRWRDLDLDSCRLTVRQALDQTRASGVHFKTPKTVRSRRTITIPKILVAVLAQHRKQTDEQTAVRSRLLGCRPRDRTSFLRGRPTGSLTHTSPSPARLVCEESMLTCGDAERLCARNDGRRRESRGPRRNVRTNEENPKTGDRSNR
jgi:integrase